jgi:Zn-finger nucleic acid-binding protein
MPLLVSPIDGQTPMQQIKRDGIEIDRCPVSGGVWLDKGELEKLLAAVQHAAQEDREHYADYRQSVPQRPSRAHYDDDYEDYHHKKYGRKSKMKSIFDLFD